MLTYCFLNTFILSDHKVNVYAQCKKFRKYRIKKVIPIMEPKDNTVKF